MNVPSPGSSGAFDARSRYAALIEQTLQMESITPEIVCQNLEVSYEIVDNDRKVLSQQALVTILDRRWFFSSI